MPKVKTHSSAKKRFKLTGSGKVKRFQAFTSHMMRNKGKKAKLRLRDATLVSQADEKRIKRLLGLRQNLLFFNESIDKEVFKINE